MNQITDKRRIQGAWQKKLKSFPTSTEAHAAGYSFAALAEQLGVSRQRVCNQMTGSATISAPLRALLEKHLDLPEPPQAQLPAPRTYEDVKQSARDQQRQIQARINDGAIERIPAVLLEDKKLIRKWRKLIKQHGGKSAAIRALIQDS